MHIRDRIRELRRVKASELRPNPRNWRLHPPAQHDALRGVLAEVGFADAVLARELEDGSLELIDGHLRAEVSAEAVIPVLVVDVTQAEADLVLATHDPLAAMAEADHQAAAALLAGIETESQAVRAMLDRLTTRDQTAAALEPPPPVELKESYQVVVECRDEDQQREVFERLRGEGFFCRVLTL